MLISVCVWRFRQELELDIRGTIHDFSVWLRTGSHPPNNNRFRRHTGKVFLEIKIQEYKIHFYLNQLYLHVEQRIPTTN